MNKFLLAFLLVGYCARAQMSPGYEPVKVKDDLRQAIVCAHPLAANAGELMFLYGGNAFDAAIATQLALAVVYPRAGNLGGGGFLVARLADHSSFTIDFRETAPSAAHRDMYVDPATGKADTSRSLNGPSSCGIPGTVAGLFETYKYAKLPFDSLINPAIRLAENGFRITALEAEKLNANRLLIAANNKTATVFSKSVLWQAGDTLRQPELAETLKRIRNKGRDEFYKGITAQLILEEMNRQSGFISAGDLAAYSVVRRTPLQFRYKEYTLISMPPPSSGGIIMQQVLTMLQLLEQQYGDEGNETDLYHRFLEAERRAFADRSRWLGDPSFVQVQVDSLISVNYLTKRLSGFNPAMAGHSNDIGPGTFESDETTHLSVVDAEGNALSITTTLNGNYGSKTVVTGAGFFLNNEMDDFSIQPGVANQFGAIGGAANAIAPGKRMLSSMSPLIVLKNDSLFAVLGAPGGTTIPSSVMLTFLRMVELGHSPEHAVNAPRVHHQWVPDLIYLEPGIDQPMRASLEKYGYTLKDRSYFGTIELIVKGNSGYFTAVADRRGDDSIGK